MNPESLSGFGAVGTNGPTLAENLGYSHVGAMSTVDGYAQYGITLRQHYAGLAMQGFIANEHNGSDDATDIAKWSVEQADALLAALTEEAK